MRMTEHAGVQAPWTPQLPQHLCLSEYLTLLSWARTGCKCQFWERSRGPANSSDLSKWAFSTKQIYLLCWGWVGAVEWTRKIFHKTRLPNSPITTRWQKTWGQATLGGLMSNNSNFARNAKKRNDQRRMKKPNDMQICHTFYVEMPLPW